MGIFISALIGGLWSVLGSFVGQVLISLGISYLVFTGVDVSIDFARDTLINSILQTNPQIVAICSTLKVGRIVSILSSAVVGRATLQGLSSGKLRVMTGK
ncbi:DUF2523 family protein [Paucibacter sp. APW11]|uniref:DUF2523 family protein n=1 Tax=Roseateles aquae TaxID=3077235 RepID=A0ABU3P5B9_9BURK|nr:DUF2523 family protein [Paucibacter sp. APW11]MDT8997773.1 DUF2523 family protein [Paucibacter sp. APW11]